MDDDILEYFSNLPELARLPGNLPHDRDYEPRDEENGSLLDRRVLNQKLKVSMV